MTAALWLAADLAPWALIAAFAVLMTVVARIWCRQIDDNRQLRADLAERDAEIDRLATFIDQQQASHIAAAEEWADRCREITAIALALDIETRTS